MCLFVRLHLHAGLTSGRGSLGHRTHTHTQKQPLCTAAFLPSLAVSSPASQPRTRAVFTKRDVIAILQNKPFIQSSPGCSPSSTTPSTKHTRICSLYAPYIHTATRKHKPVSDLQLLGGKGEEKKYLRTIKHVLIVFFPRCLRVSQMLKYGNVEYFYKRSADEAHHCEACRGQNSNTEVGSGGETTVTEST